MAVAAEPRRGDRKAPMWLNIATHLHKKQGCRPYGWQQAPWQLSPERPAPPPWRSLHPTLRSCW